MFTPITNKATNKDSKGLIFKNKVKNNDICKTSEEKHQSLAGLIILITCLLACSLVIQNSEASENSTARNFFLPADMNFFYSDDEVNNRTISYSHNSSLRSSHNLSAKFSDKATSQWLATFSRSLDNEALLQTVENLKSNAMSSSQRGHNYRWIQQGSNDSSKHAKSIVRKIISSTVKTYWDQWRLRSFSNLSVIPDSEGKGNLHWQRQEIDYRVKVTGDDIKFIFKIDFN